MIYVFTHTQMLFAMMTGLIIQNCSKILPDKTENTWRHAFVEKIHAQNILIIKYS